jgi:hypothetical protein
VRNYDIEEKYLTRENHLHIRCILLAVNGARLNPDWGPSLAEEVCHQANNIVVPMTKRRRTQLLAG